MKTISPAYDLYARLSYSKLVDELNSGKVTIQQTANKLGITEERTIRKLRNLGYHKKGKYFVYNGECD